MQPTVQTPLYSAQLSARYRNFLVPMLTLGTLGGVNALMVAHAGSADAGMWPLAWLLTLVTAAFFSGTFCAMAGRRKLSIAYGVWLSGGVGMALVAYLLWHESLRAPWGLALPLWMHSAPVRAVLGSPWSFFLPHLAGLGLHGAAMWAAVNRRPSPENPG